MTSVVAAPSLKYQYSERIAAIDCPTWSGVRAGEARVSLRKSRPGTLYSTSVSFRVVELTSKIV